MRSYIGKLISVTIDRPMGSHHPEYPDTVYSVNYGYLKDTLSPDGEELDCYVLGVNRPVSEYTGRCIAAIFRENDDDPKLVVAPDGVELGDPEIEAAVAFIERHFKAKIIR